MELGLIFTKYEYYKVQVANDTKYKCKKVQSNVGVAFHIIIGSRLFSQVIR
jgi:hypothetical protein